MLSWASSFFSNRRSIFGSKSVNLLVHLSLSDVMLAVLVVALMMMSSLMKGTIVGTWVTSVAIVWLISPLPLGEWWKILRSEAVDFLIHASLGDILLVMLFVVSVLVLNVRCWITSVCNNRFFCFFSPQQLVK